MELWRVFPWDPTAAPGQPFSPGYVPPAQGSGRFDLHDNPVLYGAELAEHAVAEKIGRYRGAKLEDYHLHEFGQRLALVKIDVPTETAAAILDLCDPAVLARYSIRPDHVVAREISTSQGVSRTVYAAGLSGLRVWSVFFGEWHSVVLFLDRVPLDTLRFADPSPLTLESPELASAAAALGIKLGTP